MYINQIYHFIFFLEDVKHFKKFPIYFLFIFCR